MSLLEVKDLSVKYGPIPALRGLSLSVDEGETVAVLGANGAGKSTLTLAITGVVRPVAGTVGFAGEMIAGLLPEIVARRGISLVPEGRHIFEGLTVEENLMLGLTARTGREGVAADLADINALFPILDERRASIATRLSGGEQQQLAIARALLSRPRLLILDEPSLGLSPIMVDRVYAILKTLKKRGVTLLLVEQNAGRVGEVADRIVVIANGVVQVEGPAADLLAGDRLGDAYRGRAKARAAS
jgi:branched-chain amino acid transport system ATP-binding protein